MEPINDEPSEPERKGSPVPVQYRGGSKPGQKKVPDVLKDLRAVYKQHKSKDTAQQKPLRKMYENSPEKFVDRLMSFERQFKSLPNTAKNASVDGGGKEQESGTKPVGEQEVDEGEAKCVELLERLLREKLWEKQT